MSALSDDQPTAREDQDDVESLSTEILALLGQVTKRFASEEEEQWRWIVAHSPNPEVVELMRDATITAMRVLDAIGRLEPVNGITIGVAAPYSQRHGI